jgi:hypothetical protein
VFARELNMKNAKKTRALKSRNVLVDTTASENNETMDMDITNLKGVGLISSPPRHIKDDLPSNKTLLAKDFDVQGTHYYFSTSTLNYVLHKYGLF